MDTTGQDLGLRVVSLRDLWDIFVQRFLVMFLAAALVAGGAFAYKHFTFVPHYESTATLYLVNQSNYDEDSSSSTYNNFSLALKLVNDCGHLIKSHSVLDQAIGNLNLNMTYEDLYEAVAVSNPEETRILEVSVEADSPQNAKSIVDEICEIGVGKIEEAMGFEQAKLYEHGVLNEEPCNTTSITMYAILGLLAAVAVYAFFLVRFLLDDRIRTEEDIERVLGLSILGDIPNADDPKKGRGYYGKKGYGAAPSGRATVKAEPRGKLPAQPVEKAPAAPSAHAARPANNPRAARPAGAQARPVRTEERGQ